MNQLTLTLKLMGVLLVEELVAIKAAISAWFHKVETFTGEAKFRYLNYKLGYHFDEVGNLVKVNSSIRVQESVLLSFMSDVVSFFTSDDYSLCSIGKAKYRLSDRYFSTSKVDGVGNAVYTHMQYKPRAVEGKVMSFWELTSLRIFGVVLKFDAVTFGVKVWNYLHAGYMKAFGIMRCKVIVLENMLNDGFGYILDSTVKDVKCSSLKLSTCFVNVEGNLGVIKGVMRKVSTYDHVLACHTTNPELALKVWNALLTCKGMVVGSNEAKCLKDRDGVALYTYGVQYDAVFGIKSHDGERPFHTKSVELSYQNAARSAHVLHPIHWERHVDDLLGRVRTRKSIFALGHGPYNRIMNLFGLANKNIPQRYQDLRASIIRKAARPKMAGFRCYAALGVDLADDEVGMSIVRYKELEAIRPDDSHHIFVKRDPDHGWAIQQFRVKLVKGLGNVILLPASFFSKTRGDMDGDLYTAFWGIPSGAKCHDVPEKPTFPMVRMSGSVSSEYDQQVVATQGKEIGYPDWFSICLEESGWGSFARNFRYFALQEVIDGLKHGLAIDIVGTIKAIKARMKDKKCFCASNPSRAYYTLNNKTKPETFKENTSAVFTPQLTAVISRLDHFVANMWHWDNATETVRWTDIASKARLMTQNHIPRKGYIQDVFTCSPELQPTIQAYWDAENGVGPYSACRDAFRSYLDSLKAKYKTMEYLRHMSWACAKIWGTGRFYLAIMLALEEKELIVAHTAISSYTKGAGVQNKVNFLLSLMNTIKGVEIEDDIEAIDSLL